MGESGDRVGTLKLLPDVTRVFGADDSIVKAATKLAAAYRQVWIES